jgi:thiol-disulfide isomerase/thioredoxin
MKIAVVVCLSLLPLTAGARGSEDKKEPKARVGMMAPDLPLTHGKKPLTLASFRGKPVLIHFWASWCGPCKVSMPEFQRVGEAFKKTDLVVLMLDHDESPADAHLALMNEHITWPDYHDEDKRIEKAFGGGAIPATVLIDRDGVVRYHHVGGAMGEEREKKLLQAIANAVATPAGAATNTGDTTP